jgi:F1F0 ATPase subunit 2
MAMNDMLSLMLATGAGGLLGLFFFGGLWWTVRRAFDSSSPALWVGASLLIRMLSVGVGFAVVSAGDWRRLLSCLLGFWTARWLVVRLTAQQPLEPPTALYIPLELANEQSRNDATLDEDRTRYSGTGAT